MDILNKPIGYLNRGERKHIVKLLLFMLFISLLFFYNKINRHESFFGYIPTFALSHHDHSVIAFYNCENLFDTIDAPYVKDYEYLPESAKKWDTEKYDKKLKNLSRVILGVGNWVGPDVIGLCEVENRKVLEDLTTKTNMAKFGYKILHKDSPDQRGIDVALLYKEKHFKLINYIFFKVQIPENSRPTRDILYAQGVLNKKDTLYIFVNHWPSRYGGEAATIPKRKYAGMFLRQKVDSIVAVYPNAKIIITGDFNDNPTDPSITEELGAMNNLDEEGLLFNTSYRLLKNEKLGTHKYRDEWSLFDQFIVSRNFFDTKGTTFMRPTDSHIYMPDWLQEDDNQYFGKRPYRTHRGNNYLGGYSDHFPVYILLEQD